MTFEINSLVPELWVSDFEASLAFYIDTLEFEVVQRRGTDTHVYIAFQGSQIMLAWWAVDGTWEPWHPKPLERPFGRGINFQFMISGVEAFYDRVTAKGVVPFLELYTASIWRTDRIDERRQFIVLDPDGYALRFSEKIGFKLLD